MNDPPDQTAEFNAANLLSVGGITVPKYSLKISSFSRKSRIRIFKDDTHDLQVLPSCCGKQLQIHTEQKHQQDIFALLQEYQVYQMLL